MDHLLEIKELAVKYETGRSAAYALNGVNLIINKGEAVGLVGESGAGKTTTALATLNLLLQPAGKRTGGEILFHGKSIFDMKEKELMEMRGNKISMIFQNPLTSLNPVFTVGEQIAMVLRKHQDLKKRSPSKPPESSLKQLEFRRYGLLTSRTNSVAVCVSGLALRRCLPVIRNC